MQLRFASVFPISQGLRPRKASLGPQAGECPSKAQVAQLVEQRTENPRVGGSIPPLGTSLHKGLERTLAGCASYLATNQQPNYLPIIGWPGTSAHSPSPKIATFQSAARAQKPYRMLVADDDARGVPKEFAIIAIEKRASLKEAYDKIIKERSNPVT